MPEKPAVTTTCRGCGSLRSMECVGKRHELGRVEVTVRSVCVFCGSSTGNSATYAEQARRLGAALAARGIGLVFGGGRIGLMGVVADAVLAAGGRVEGVIPKALVDAELAHEGVTRLHVVGTMHERKALMADLADGFIAMPGGFGTADELFEILTWSQLGLSRKPVGLLNVAGFFDPLLAWLDRCVDQRFLQEHHRNLLLTNDDVDRLLQQMSEFQPLSERIKWIDAEDR
jgi:uncharacterized protein (TIGR00730 family)